MSVKTIRNVINTENFIHGASQSSCGVGEVLETQSFQGSPTRLSVSLTDESELMFDHFSPESNTTPKHEDHKFRGNLGYIVTYAGLVRGFNGQRLQARSLRT